MNNHALMTSGWRVVMPCWMLLCAALPAVGDESEPPIPALDWVAAMGGAAPGARAEAHGVVVDARGHVFVTGSFEGTVAFGPGPGAADVTSQNVADMFVMKLDREGGVLWVRSMQSSWNSRGLDIAVDGAGNVVVAGYFEGVTDLDPGPDSAMTASQGTGRDIVVMKLNGEGALVWSHAFSSEGANEARGVAVNADGDVFVTGYFEQTMDFDPGADRHFLTSSDPDSLFVLHLDAEGAFRWVRTVRAFDAMAGDDGSVRGNAMVLDADGDGWLTGEFRGTADFQLDPGLDAPIVLTSNTHLRNAFVMRFDASGATRWARMMGGAADGAPEVFSGSPGAEGRAIALDAEGNAYVTGMYAIYAGMFGSFDLNFAWFFGPFEFAYPNRAMFTCKVSADGEFLWAHPTTTYSTWNQPAVLADAATSIAVGGDGTVFGAGDFAIAAFFEGIETDLPGDPPMIFAIQRGMFVQRFTADGEFLWANAVRSSSGSATGRGHALAASSAGHLHFAGSFAGVMDFDLGLDEWPVDSGEAEGAPLTALFVQKLRIGDDDEPEPVFGDINGDGMVNAVDVQLVINAALGNPIEHGNAADVNGDGVVNAIDVQLVINAALGVAAR